MAKMIKGEKEFVLLAGCDPDLPVQGSYVVSSIKELIEKVQRDWRFPASRIKEAAREALQDPDGSSSAVQVPSVCRDCERKKECQKRGWTYRLAFDIEDEED